MKEKVLIAVLSLFAFIIIGCSESPSSPDRYNVRAIFNPFSSSTGYDYAAWMSASITNNEWFFYSDTTKTDVEYKTIEDFMDCGALFYNDSWRRVVPDQVTFDGINLLTEDNTKYFVRYDSLSYSMNGDYYTWLVDSSSAFPGLTDSILAPSAEVAITSHSVNDSVSREDDLTVTWTSTTDSCVVVVVVTGADIDIDPVSFVDVTDDDGSYTVDSSELEGYDPQKITISLSRGTYKIGDLDDGRKYLMCMYSQHNVDVRLVE